MNCGRNALYLLLRLHRVNVSYGAVERALGVNEQGSSLLEIRDAAVRLGLKARVRRFTPDDLGGRPLPLIVLFNNKFSQGPSTGHYGVVLKVDDRLVTFLDGTTGALTRFKRERFPLFWDGYVVEDASVPVAWWVWATAGGLMVLAGAVGLVTLRGRGRETSAPGGPRGAASFASVVVLAAAAVGHPAEGASTPDRPWRTPENDGLNCLYLMLKVADRPATYEAVRGALPREGGRVSLGGLLKAARRLGTGLRIHRCGPDDLARLPLPVIALMDDPRGDGGEFVLVYRLGEAHYALIQGASMTVQEMPADDFCRNWSGYLLAADPPRGAWVPSAVAGLVAASGYAYWRARSSGWMAGDGRRACAA